MTISEEENVRSSIDTLMIIVSIILSVIAVIACCLAISSGFVTWQWIAVSFMWFGAAFAYDHIEGKINYAFATFLLICEISTWVITVIVILSAIVHFFS